MLSHLKKESMHHAFVIEGDILQTRPALFDFLKKEFGMDAGHNDLMILDRGDFGIENVQEIVDVNSRKPTIGMYKVIVVGLHSISYQAQNAILKTLEEPRPGTFIFILTNTSTIFLPTILSRVHTIKSGSAPSLKKTGPLPISKEIQDTVCTVEEFIVAAPAKRISFVKKIVELKTKERIEDSDVLGFVRGIEHAIALHLYGEHGIDSSEKGSVNDMTKRKQIVDSLYTISEYIRDVSSSKKMLLEYMALLLPKF